MPSGSLDFWNSEKYMSTAEIRDIIETIAPLEPVRARKNGPSKYFKLKGAQGVVGFISALTHHFCEDCNRLRLTADGKLKPCLFSETEIDLRSALRNGSPDSEIARLLSLSIEIKPKGHALTAGNQDGSVMTPQHGHSGKRPMSKIGG